MKDVCEEEVSEERRRRRRRNRYTESKTRTPHKDVGNEEVSQKCCVFDVVNFEK